MKLTRSKGIGKQNIAGSFQMIEIGTLLFRIRDFLGPFRVKFIEFPLRMKAWA
jgi:hypothetical protein